MVSNSLFCMSALKVRGELYNKSFSPAEQFFKQFAPDHIISGQKRCLAILRCDLQVPVSLLRQ